jgi:hypothetical protein
MFVGTLPLKVPTGIPNPTAEGRTAPRVMLVDSATNFTGLEHVHCISRSV